MQIDREFQVVIVGAGPVGLMLAVELRLAGVDVLVAEQRGAGTTGESRAPGLNARTMEVLEQRGLADEFRRRGKELPFVVFAAIPLDPRAVDPGWPAALILPQHETERILRSRAEELGAELRWATAAVGVEQDEHGVAVQLRTSAQPGAEPDPSSRPEPDPEVVRARYVVGCDGGRSAVRASAEIAFPGVAPESWWVVGDLDLAEPPDAASAFGHNDRVGYYQVSQAEPGWHRLSLMYRTPPADPARPVTLDELRQVMIDGLGTDHGLRGARWMSRWSDGYRHAARYRDRRVLLAGDAAHTHTPIGGQGLNLGIQDAVNLGWKLAAVLRGEATEALLDSYHDERWPVGAAALRQSMTQTELVKPGPRRAATRDVLAELLTNPTTVTQLSGELSGLSLRYPLGEGHALLGRRMPDLPLLDPRTVDGRREGTDENTSVFSLLRDARPLLVDLADSLPPEGLGARTGRTRVVRARYEPERKDGLWHLPVVGDIAPFDAFLVRPDGYVAWIRPTADPFDLDALIAALGFGSVPAEQRGDEPEAGTWDLAFTTPGGERRAVLVLQRTGSAWTGTYDDRPTTETIVHDRSVRFTSTLKSPFPARVRWTGMTDGDTMTGEAKASFMTLPFTGTRRM